MAKYYVSEQESDEIIKEIIEKEIELVGSAMKYEDLKNIDEWYNKHTLNLEQYKQLHDYFVTLVKKFGWNKRTIEMEFGNLMLDYGFNYEEEVYKAILGK